MSRHRVLRAEQHSLSAKTETKSLNSDGRAAQRAEKLSKIRLIVSKDVIPSSLKSAENAADEKLTIELCLDSVWKERSDTIFPKWTFTALSLVPVRNHNKSVVVQKTRKLVRWLPNTERWEKWVWEVGRELELDFFFFFFFFSFF